MPMSTLPFASTAAAAQVSAPAPRSAGHACSVRAGGLPSFGTALGEAMQDHQALAADSPASPPAAHADSAKTEKTASAASAATAPGADTHPDPSGNDEPAPADTGQLAGELQAFVSSLPPTVPAMTVATPAAAGAATLGDTGPAPAVNPGLRDIAAASAGTQRASPALVIDRDEQSHAHVRQDAVPEPGDAGAQKANGEKAALASALAPATAASEPGPAFQALLNDAATDPSGMHGTPDAGTTDPHRPAAAAAAVATTPAIGTPAAGPALGAVMHTAHVAPSLHAPPWAHAFGEQVVWIARQDQQIARLTLNPPELGPVRVTLTIAEGQASAAFVSAQAEVRQAIQDAVPRLKEMFADAGLQLQQASVGSGDAGADARASAKDNAGPGRRAADDARPVDAAAAGTPPRLAASRLVDLFA